VSRHTLGIVPFSNAERMVVVDMLLRLAPCAWALSPTAVANDDPSSATSRHRSVHGHQGCFYVSSRLTVSDARVALPDFYDVTIRIAHVAARLAVLFLWLCDKLGSSTSP